MAVMAGEICDFSLFFFTKIDRPPCLNWRDPFFFGLVRFVVNFWCAA